MYHSVREEDVKFPQGFVIEFTKICLSETCNKSLSYSNYEECPET